MRFRTLTGKQSIRIELTVIRSDFKKYTGKYLSVRCIYNCDISSLYNILHYKNPENETQQI